MSDLIRDWLLDPLALLFLLSIAFGLAWLMGGRRGGSGRGRGGRRRRAGTVRRLLPLVLWCGCFLVASAPAIVNPFVAVLEDHHPANVECPAGTPLVVLGGGVDSRVRDAGEYERMRPATLARVAAAERIAIAEPTVTLVLAGGGLGGDLSRVPEAGVMSRFLLAREGFPDSVTLYRDVRSGDTAGNAREVVSILSGGDVVTEGRPPAIRLLTSALHMPRALATFRAAGLDPCPVPVAPIALPDVPAWALMPQTTALVKFDALLHELVALAVYRLRGDL